MPSLSVCLLSLCAFTALAQTKAPLRDEHGDLGTYPILVTATNASGTISHSALAMLGVTLGSSPGSTVTLGTIRVQQARAGGNGRGYRSSNSATIQGCSTTTATGVTVTPNRRANGDAWPLPFGDGRKCFNCATSGAGIDLPIEPGPGLPLEVTAVQQPGGEFEFTVSSSYLEEIDYVSGLQYGPTCMYPDHLVRLARLGYVRY